MDSDTQRISNDGDNIAEIFEAFQNHLTKEQNTREEIREIVKELEQSARQMMTTLQAVHRPHGLNPENISQLVGKVQQTIETGIRGWNSQLASKIPKEEFYRFHEQWKFVTQRLVFVVAFAEFLLLRTLLTREQAAAKLNLSCDRSLDMLYLDLEDYLHGILLLPNELTRLAVNAVTAADYTLPLEIVAFMTDLDAGFRLLSLKNDSLRKKFDSLKYDMKKVEEVKYDISIRGLTSHTAASS